MPARVATLSRKRLAPKRINRLAGRGSRLQQHSAVSAHLLSGGLIFGFEEQSPDCADLFRIEWPLEGRR